MVHSITFTHRSSRIWLMPAIAVLLLALAACTPTTTPTTAHGLAHRCHHIYQYADSNHRYSNPSGSANCDAHSPSHRHGSCHIYIFTPRPPLRLES